MSAGDDVDDPDAGTNLKVRDASEAQTILLLLVLLLLTTTTKKFYCLRESIVSISLQISFSICGALKQSSRVLRPN